MEGFNQFHAANLTYALQLLKTCSQVLWKGIWEIRKNLFWSIKNLGENLDEFKAREFIATSLSFMIFLLFHYFTSQFN